MPEITEQSLTEEMPETKKESLIKYVKGKKSLFKMLFIELRDLTSSLPVGKAENILATRRLQECNYWLSEVLNELEHRYPNSANPEIAINEPVQEIK